MDLGLSTSAFNLKAISEHAFKIDQTAVGHRCIRAIVQIMVVNIPFFGGHWLRVWASILRPIDLPTIPRRQIPLRIKDYRCPYWHFH